MIYLKELFQLKFMNATLDQLKTLKKF